MLVGASYEGERTVDLRLFKSKVFFNNSRIIKQLYCINNVIDGLIFLFFIFFLRIKSLEEEIISKKIKLIIIDSVASVVRKEFDTKLQGNLAERSNFLARGASLLKYLAEEFSIPVSSSFLSFCFMVSNNKMQEEWK